MGMGGRFRGREDASGEVMRRRISYSRDMYDERKIVFSRLMLLQDQ
jgi:hypothetical protein